MTNPRFTKNLGPLVPHHQSKEERDLRSDTYAALSEIADALGVVIQLEADDMDPGDAFVKVRGLALNGPTGDPVPDTVFELVVFQDENGVDLASDATLDTATSGKGTILSTSPATALIVKTNASGVFECTLSDTEDETVHLAADHTTTGPAVHCLGSLAIEFIAP